MTENLDLYPAYIRFEPKNDDDEWNVELVHVTVNPDTDRVEYQALQGTDRFGHPDNLWLGHKSGVRGLPEGGAPAL